VLFAHLIRHLRGLAGLVPENAFLELIRFYNFCTHLIAHIPWPSGASALYISFKMMRSIFNGDCLVEKDFFIKSH